MPVAIGTGWSSVAGMTALGRSVPDRPAAGVARAPGGQELQVLLADHGGAVDTPLGAGRTSFTLPTCWPR